MSAHPIDIVELNKCYYYYYSHIYPGFRAQHCKYATLLAGRQVLRACTASRSPSKAIVEKSRI